MRVVDRAFGCFTHAARNHIEVNTGTPYRFAQARIDDLLQATNALPSLLQGSACTQFKIGQVNALELLLPLFTELLRSNLSLLQQGIEHHRRVPNTRRVAQIEFLADLGEGFVGLLAFLNHQVKCLDRILDLERRLCQLIIDFLDGLLRLIRFRL